MQCVLIVTHEYALLKPLREYIWLMNPPAATLDLLPHLHQSHFLRLIPANAREEQGYKGRPNPVIKKILPTGP